MQAACYTSLTYHNILICLLCRWHKLFSNIFISVISFFQKVEEKIPWPEINLYLWQKRHRMTDSLEWNYVVIYHGWYIISQILFRPAARSLSSGINSSHHVRNNRNHFDLLLMGQLPFNTLVIMWCLLQQETPRTCFELRAPGIMDDTQLTRSISKFIHGQKCWYFYH